MNAQTWTLTLDELYKSPYIIYKVIAGSQAYGCATKDSDTDIRGYYFVPKKIRNSMFEYSEQINDKSNDIVFYDLKRAFELLMTANPNQIELLWIPDDCVEIKHPVIDQLIKNRKLFISKAAYESHFQYSQSQIHKAKGQNKWVNNPKPKDPPDKLDFCYYINALFDGHLQYVAEQIGMPVSPMSIGMPCRPVLIKNTDINLSQCHIAKLERAENMYRLYEYGAEAKGVFRGKNQQLVTESIPYGDEWKKIKGLLIYNDQAYRAALKDWKNYWDWVKNRNESRWISQENGELDFDSKNMHHCIRLMLSSKNILKNGSPIVRFEGEKQVLLMQIKQGAISYKEIMKMVKSLQKEIDTLLNKTKIPETVDFNKINAFYLRLSKKIDF